MFAGAPGPGQLSVYDLLPPERAVEGVGMARAPAAFAPAPAPADGGFTSPLGGQVEAVLLAPHACVPTSRRGGVPG